MGTWSLALSATLKRSGLRFSNSASAKGPWEFGAGQLRCPAPVPQWAGRFHLQSNSLYVGVHFPDLASRVSHSHLASSVMTSLRIVHDSLDDSMGCRSDVSIKWLTSRLLAPSHPLPTRNLSLSHHTIETRGDAHHNQHSSVVILHSCRLDHRLLSI